MLKQNYPNPFNPSTTIEFSLKNSYQKNVSLKIFDLLGRHISTLVDTKLISGIHRFKWDGSDISGNQVTSGVYHYVLQVGDKREVKRMILVQ